MINVKNLAVLYPWEEALKASPAGWRLPTSGDWEQLEIELGMDPDECRDLWMERYRPGGTTKRRWQFWF